MRRLILLLAALALAVTACGSSSGGASSAPSAGAILASVKPFSGPEKLTLKMTIAVDGSPAAAGAAAALLSQPIEVTADGTSDSTTKSFDLDLKLSLGALDIPVKLLTDGKHAWLQYGGDWYDLGDLANAGGIAGSVTGTTTPSIDPAQLRSLIGDPASLLKDARVVGDEDAAGVASTHVAGSIDVAALMAMVQKVASAQAAGSTTAADLSSATATVTKALKAATIDLWVGKDDHVVHRTSAHIVVDLRDVAAASGVNGVTVDLDSTASATDPLTITPPANPKPASELQQALLGSLGPALTGTTG